MNKVTLLSALLILAVASGVAQPFDTLRAVPSAVEGQQPPAQQPPQGQGQGGRQGRGGGQGGARGGQGAQGAQGQPRDPQTPATPATSSITGRVLAADT